MANNIATVSIPACVVQQKNSVFVSDGVIVPQVKNIPCREVDVDDIGYWATPVNDNGLFTSLKFEPQKDEIGNAIPAPSYLSFNTFRVRDKISTDFWYIVGTIEDFYASCQTCCGIAFIPMPCTVPIVPVCQEICDNTNDDGDYISTFGLPAITGDECFLAYGAYNGVELPALSASSYNELLTELAANWHNIGSTSPAVTLTWAISADLLSLIAVGGNLGDSICVVIMAGECSP